MNGRGQSNLLHIDAVNKLTSLQISVKLVLFNVKIQLRFVVQGRNKQGDDGILTRVVGI